MSEGRRHSGAHRARKAASYPVARPYAPPPPKPAAVPTAPPVLPVPSLPRRPSSSFVGAWDSFGTPAKGFMLVTLAVACTWAGWYTFRGAGKRSKDASAVAKVEGPSKTIAASVDDKPPSIPLAKETRVAKAEDRSTPPPVARPTPAPAPMPAPSPAPKPSAPSEEPKTAALNFEKHVLPIFEAKCISCHGANNKKKGGLDMRTVANLLKGGDGGPSLVPGSTQKSLLWETIETNRMPPGGKNKLSTAERATVQKWISEGAKTSAMATAQAK